jgi:hypothetical protein
MDYLNGRIYCIRNNVDDDVYVGSTCQSISKRMAKHRGSMNEPKRDTKIYVKMRELGADNFYIELIEECPCENKEQLRKREGHFIREMGTLNKNIAGRTVQEQNKAYYENNKEQIYETCKTWKEANPEKVIAYKQKWYANNKEDIAIKGKERYEENKEQICEQQKEYRENNKELLKERYNANKETIQARDKAWRIIKHDCDCGGSFSNSDKARHLKTKKHQTYLEKNKKKIFF